MPSFPSLLLIFSLYRGSLTLEIIYFSSASHDSHCFSLVVSFLSKAFDVFQPVDFASPTNAHKQWRCKSLQPLLALAIAQHSWCCWAGIFRGLLQQSRLQTDWDMFGGSAMFATRGGWKTETLYGNLLTLKTAWLLAKSEKSQHNFSKPPVQPFIIYLSTAVRGIFLSVTLVHHLP